MRARNTRSRSRDLPLAAEELGLWRVLRARIHAVHAHVALRLVPRRAADGIVSALAMHQAAIAVVAACRILVQAENRSPRYGAQQCAQRTQRAAPEACDA